MAGFLVSIQAVISSASEGLTRATKSAALSSACLVTVRGPTRQCGTELPCCAS